jgi:hypothetical protein
MSSGKSQGLGFDGWMNKLKTEFGTQPGRRRSIPMRPWMTSPRCAD